MLSKPLSNASNWFPIVKSAYGLFTITKSFPLTIFDTNKGEVTGVSLFPVTVPAAVFTKSFISYEIPFPVSAKFGRIFTSPFTLCALNSGIFVVTSTYAPFTVISPWVVRVPPIDT